jgi:hypothetical protein
VFAESRSITLKHVRAEVKRGASAPAFAAGITPQHLQVTHGIVVARRTSAAKSSRRRPSSAEQLESVVNPKIFVVSVGAPAGST